MNKKDLIKNELIKMELESNKIADILQFIDEHISFNGIEINELTSFVKETCMGHYESKEDFLKNHLYGGEFTLTYNISETLANAINWEEVGADLFRFEYFQAENGYIFNINATW